MWMVGGACGADLVSVAAEEHDAPVFTRALQHWVRAVLVRGTGQVGAAGRQRGGLDTCGVQRKVDALQHGPLLGRPSEWETVEADELPTLNERY